MAREPRKPKPLAITPDARVEPSSEEFNAWALHPVTRYVAAAFTAAAQAQRDDWMMKSWGSGSADPLELRTLQTRADAYMALLETGLNDYAKLLATQDR